MSKKPKSARGGIRKSPRGSSSERVLNEAEASAHNLALAADDGHAALEERLVEMEKGARNVIASEGIAVTNEPFISQSKKLPELTGAAMGLIQLEQIVGLRMWLERVGFDAVSTSLAIDLGFRDAHMLTLHRETIHNQSEGAKPVYDRKAIVTRFQQLCAEGKRRNAVAIILRNPPLLPGATAPRGKNIRSSIVGILRDAGEWKKNDGN